jgi:hypothetical protein
VPALAARHARRVRGHPPTLTAHDRSLDKTAVDRLGTESEAVAEDDPMESRAPAASDDLVLNTVSALAEFERIEGLVAPLDVAAFRRNRAKIAKLSTAILGDLSE